MQLELNYHRLDMATQKQERSKLQSSVDLRNMQRTLPSGDIRASLKATGKLLLVSVGPGFPGWLTEVLTPNLDLD